MNLRKTIATFLSVSMLSAMLPVVSHAELTSTARGEKAKVKMVLMQSDNDVTTGLKYKVVGSDQIDKSEDSVFYVGILTDDFENIYEVANYKKVDGKPNRAEKFGLSEICFGISFNDTYLELEPGVVEDEGDYDAGVVLNKLVSRVTWTGTDEPISIVNGDSGTEGFGTGAATKRKYTLYSADLLNQNSEVSTTDEENGFTKRISLSATCPSTDYSFPWSGKESTYFAILEFKFKSDCTDLPAGTKLVGFTYSPNGQTLNTLVFGQDGNISYPTEYTVKYEDNHKNTTGDYTVSPQDIRTIVDFEDLDLFPDPDSVRTLQSIAVKGGTYTIPPQYVGKALNVTGLTIEGTYSKEPTTADITTGITYYYGDTGKTAVGDLTEVPAALTADMNGKYLYAVVEGKIAEVGQLSVSAVVINGVTSVTNTPTGVYEGQTIDMTGISATVSKNDTSTANIPYAELATNGLAIYRVTGSNDAKTYTKVTASDKYDLGANIFVVGKDVVSGTPDFMSPGFTVNAAYDAKTVTKVTGPKEKYKAGDNFDPSAIKVNVKKITESTGTDVAYADFTPDLTVVIAADTTAALTATKADADTKITEDMINNGHKVYVVVDNNGTKTAVEVGTISSTSLSGTVSGITSDAKTYGDTLGDGMSLTIKYDNGDPDKTVAYDDFATNSITMKITVDGTEVTLDKDKILTPDMTGKTVDFYVNGKKVTSSVALTVNKKAVNVDLSHLSLEAPAVQKTYDGTTAIPADRKDAVMPKINSDDLVAKDKTDGKYAGLTIDPDSVTIVYNDKNVGKSKTLNYSGTPAVKVTDTNADVVANFAKYYTLNSFTDSNNTYTDENIEIKVKKITIIDITGVPSIEVGAEELTGTSTMALSTSNSDIISGENVTLSYKYTYFDSSTASDEATVTISDVSLTGTDAGNYDIKEFKTTVKGKVTNKKLNSISVVGPTKTEYTYPDTKLDLTGMSINLNYEGASEATTMTVAGFIADGGIISLTDVNGQTVTVTADNMKDVIGLAYGDTTLSIAYGGKTATQFVKASKKKISLADITFNASKVYGNDTVTGTYTVADGVIVAGDEVTIEATYTFTESPETAGENKAVSITNIALAGDAAANYELDGTETTINTGIVSQGSQVAPATPTVTVDSATNNLTITGPIGENIEYSIDGGNTWVTNTTFTGIANGKTVTVMARVKASEDGNLEASEASSTTATTYKYHVVVYQAKTTTGTVLKEIYTNDISVAASDTDVNSKIFASKPSGFKAYFSDSDATTAQTYPLTADANGEVVLYMTKASSSGGGGGSSTYKVTFSAGSNGKITEGKAIYNVTSKVTTVPTVTAKEGYTFIGWSQDGTTVVDPLTVKISKATTFTALYEAEVKETPVPTVEPTEEPVQVGNEPIINVNYTAPYASGYEDGAFRPENNITRAELAAMIARLSYGGDLPDGMYASSFPDVAEDAWYNKYIAYLEDKDVISGYEDGTFRPNNTITRGEICAVIARAQRYEILPYSGMFADVIDYDWAKDYIETLAVKNIVTGYEDGTFGPYSPLTRAEAVAIINRVLAPSTPVVTFTPNDIDAHWAEADIILAVNERIVNGTEPVEETTEEVTENIEDAANVAPEDIEGTEITTETEETTEVPAE